MATTLATELTKAGCNIATATIVIQPGIGQQPPIGNPTNQTNPSKAGVVVTSTDPRLSARFVQRGSQDVPRCIAYDANAVYVWVNLPTAFQPSFQRIPITSAPYVAGTAAIPVIADF